MSTNHSLVELAKQIATEAHEGQFRRGGVIPYITHPQDVSERLEGDYNAQVVAWLHDVLEDTSLSATDLSEAGIPADLVECVCLLTKTPQTTYEEYLDKISTSPTATKVKIADMLSNLADKPTKKQIRKYAKGLLRLTR